MSAASRVPTHAVWARTRCRRQPLCRRGEEERAVAEGPRSHNALYVDQPANASLKTALARVVVDVKPVIERDLGSSPLRTAQTSTVSHGDPGARGSATRSTDMSRA
jgi:hypothetical protein